MPRMITEAKTVQRPLLEYAEKAGWKRLSQNEALNLRGGERGKLLRGVLKSSLLRLNPGFLNEQNVLTVIQEIENIPDTMAGNRKNLSWLRGRELFFDSKENRYRNVTLIDFENPENNDFFVTEEWTYSNPHKTNRADVMFIVGGLPVAVVENKNPKNRDSMEAAVSQLKRMERETPEILSCPQVFNITDTLQYFYGATWNYSGKNIFNWKKEVQGKRTKQITLEEAVLTFFDKKYFLQLIKSWILFYIKENTLNKTILKQHQTRAVEKIIKRCATPEKTRGLIWHTQGSGKTFTMITSARLLLEARQNATVLMIIDRNELEGQLESWVERIIGELQQTGILIERAESKKALQKLLKNDFRGLIISTIHKFNEMEADSCLRKDFYIFIDEAHRSVEGDLGNYLLGALPGATVIGFTGTPIDKSARGKGTFKIFGREDKKGWLDKYSIAESIEDGTTVKLKHSTAPNHLTVSGDMLERQFFSLTETEGISDIETLNKILQRSVRLRTFLKAPDRIDKVSKFIADHFKNNVQPLGYKAFLTAVDREACALYKTALDKYLPPEISQVVYTHSLNDSELLKKHQISKDQEKTVRKNFLKADFNPQILIVTDKLLTGYDAPVLYCMYLDKPMRDHVLLQAVARINRPYEDAKGRKKPCGLIVDFVGVFRSMKKALSFDSDEIHAVIEDLDILMDRFKTLITKDFQPYLHPFNLSFSVSDDRRRSHRHSTSRGNPDDLKSEISNTPGISPAVKGNDKLLEKLLYETLLDIEERKKFISLFEELQDLYEILSPDPELRPHLENYRKMAELYQAVKKNYKNKTFFVSEICKKTEKLIRNQTTVDRFSGISKVYEINGDTLKKLKQGQDELSDNNKIISLVRSLKKTAEEKGREEPYLLSIAERSQALMEAWSENQKNSKEALDQALSLVKEAVKACEQKKRSALSSQEFLIFWLLNKKRIPGSEELSLQISGSFDKFTNFQNNLEEQRLLKTDLYSLLSGSVSGEALRDLTAEILRLIREMKSGKTGLV